MDITPGFFTFNVLPEIKSSSRPNTSFTSSPEVLAPEAVTRARARSASVDGQHPHSLDELVLKHKELLDVNDQTKVIHKSNPLLMSAESDEIKEEDERLKKGMIKMNKLDVILSQKINKEKEVKLQRLINERLLHKEMIKFSENSAGNPSNDVTNNATKYLALLPPLQQIEVLIERCESANEFVEPIFATQFEQDSNSDLTNKTKESSSAEIKRNKEKEGKPSSGKKQNRDRNSADEDKPDFIQRNIELVKDSGNFVLMTSEEKDRLSELLNDLDSVDLEEKDEENSEQVVSIQHVNGYVPDALELERLNNINSQLLKVSNFGFDINSPIESKMTYPGFDPSVPTEVKSNLADAFSSSKRYEEIEEELNRLDLKWKNKFDNELPKLDDQTLNDLLAQCPEMITSRSSQSSEVMIDSTSLCNEELNQSTLDRLLQEARECLGLSKNEEQLFIKD